MKGKSTYFLLLVMLALVSLLWASFAAAQAPDDQEADMADSEMMENEFEELDPTNFDDPTNIDNEWWPLKPGRRLVYEGITVEEGEEVPHRIVDTVTDLTKVINGVRTVVILEEDYSDDRLTEQEIAFHAQDNDGNVWHFGQLREVYDENEFVGGRVWLVDLPEGAKAGIRMLAEPETGTPGYSQGYAPDPFNWTDRARVYQMGQETEVPTGSYDDVMVIEEWDAETPEGVFQLKYYARGVGVVRIGFRGPDPNQEEMELVEIVELDPETLAEAREQALQIEARAYMYALNTPPAELMPEEE